MKDIISFIYDPLAFKVKQILYQRLIPPIVDNRLGIIRYARYIVKICILLGISFFGFSIIFKSSKFVNLSGLLFDFAGVARIFISDEWDDLVKYYADEFKYPYGPPSYVTREMFKDDNPEIFTDENGNQVEIPSSQHLYYNRGLFLIAIGFLLQFISSIIG